MWSWLKSLLARQQASPSRPARAAVPPPSHEGVTAVPPRRPSAAPPATRSAAPKSAVDSEKALGLDWQPGEPAPETAALFTTDPDPAAGAADRGPIIGIDLGTTHSVVAVVCRGLVEVIPNQEGERLTPSVVAFTERGEVLVGAAARRQAAVNPRRTVFSVKRFLGRQSGAIHALAERMPYEVVAVPTEPPYVQVGERRWAPTEIVALILGKLKAAAETYLGQPVRRAVLTVPARFDGAQRQAVLDAALLAGFDLDWVLEDPVTRRRRRQPLRVINEPTAAALAHCVRAGPCRLAVFHMGGGTFDVSLLDSGDGVVEVKAVGGDAQLGGDDFDQALADHLLTTLPPDCQRLARRDPAALQRLREAAEQAKRDLSQSEEANVHLPCFVVDEGRACDLCARVTRAEFERLVEPLIQRCRARILGTLADAGYRPEQLDEILLVGGMTRLPRLRALFREIFGREGARGIHPDEVVAVGAALHAAQLQRGSLSEMLLLDATPLSLGLATQGDRVSVLVPRHTTIPAERSQACTTVRDNQPGVSVRVFQGEGAVPGACHFVGQLDLDGLAPAPRGHPRVEVTFSVDANSILRVTARDLVSGREKTLRMTQVGAARRAPRALLAARAQAARVCREAEELLAGCATRGPLEGLVDTLRGIAAGEDVATIHRATDGLVQALEALRGYLAGPAPPSDPPAGERAAGGEFEIDLEIR